MGHVDHLRTPDPDYIYKGQEIKDFICTYKECLCELRTLEQRILKLSFDNLFKQKHTPGEIAEMIKRPKLTASQVEGIKKYALKRISDNPKMKKYKGFL